MIFIIAGSDSDEHIIQKTTQVLDFFSISYEIEISSAHRSPQRTRQIIKTAESQNTEIFIAIAGLAAHLPGVIASETILPVIGVPVNAGPLHGQDSLLSIVQMPYGVPVATVGIDRGDNAALLAVQILSLNNSILKKELYNFKEQMK
jgi:phosphoribosylaminoimidazole carboxylase PurE protein